MSDEHKSKETGMQPPGVKSHQPPDPAGTQQATDDDDLTSGHSKPGDGGDANAKGRKT